jgi:hypothetical protein
MGNFLGANNEKKSDKQQQSSSAITRAAIVLDATDKSPTDKSPTENFSTVHPSDLQTSNKPLSQKDKKDKEDKEETGHSTSSIIRGINNETDKPTSEHIIGGSKNKKLSSKNRYSKYNIVNEINKAEKDFLGGFNSQTHSEQEPDNQSKSKSIRHIRNIIMEELDNLNKESLNHKHLNHEHLNHEHLNQLGAGCDCDKSDNQKGGSIFISSSSSSADSDSSTDFSSSDSSGVSRKKSKKNQKNSKQSRSKGKKSKKSKNNFLSDSNSDSDEFEGRLVINSNNNTSNNSNTEEGLSIFPFNSSDIKSSASDKHQKILRRKL